MSGTPTSGWWAIAVVWRGLTLALCVIGLLTAPWGLPFLSTQSNLLVLGYLACAIYWSIRRRTSDAPAPMLRGIITVDIVLVGILSHWLFAGGEFPFAGLVVADPATALLNWSAFLIHWVVPAFMLVDWVAFGPRGVVSWRRALWWIAYPTGFTVVTIVRAAVFPDVVARYPVTIFNPEVAGWGAVALAIGPLIAFALVLAMVLWAIDRAMAAVVAARVATAHPRDDPRRE